jgi:double-stranded uracil-DNA glycosylase
VGGPLPDVLPGTGDPPLRLLLVGINPGLRSAARGQHFAGPGNRFWPALHLAGLTPERFGSADQLRLPALGIGITNIVARPSARADELGSDELRAGARRLDALVAAARPAVVAVLGVTAYRQAYGRPRATVGPQPEHPRPDHPRPASTRWWVLPNPSGLNAHAQLADHVSALREVGCAAGLLSQ